MVVMVKLYHLITYIVSTNAGIKKEAEQDGVHKFVSFIYASLDK